MGKSSVASLLTSVDDLFTTQEERDASKRETVVDIPLDEISDFPNHPFKVKMDEAMMEMADSIRQYGVLVPGMVRPKEGGGYEMVAGHRRKMASELAQKPTMPCLVRDLTDDEAIIIMVDSNLQREKILPSEKAFAYKMRNQERFLQAILPTATHKSNGISASLILSRLCLIWWTRTRSPCAPPWSCPTCPKTSRPRSMK